MDHRGRGLSLKGDRHESLRQPIPGLAIPPGESLRDELVERGITQAALARQIGRPAQTVNEIVRGKKSITPETAMAFEKALGVRAEIWLGLEADFQFAKARDAVRALRKSGRPAKAAS